MSWITGLADKAENILNKIDKNAATALQLPVPGSPTNGSPTRGITTSASAPLINALQYSVYNSSFNNSTESLKTALSTHWTAAGSSKSENLNSSTTQRIKQKLNISGGSTLEPTKTSTRRSSVSSKDDALYINMADEENSETKTEGFDITENIANVFNSTEISTETAMTPPKITTTTVMEQMSSSFPTTNAQELAAFRIALSEITAERDELRLRLSALNRDVENKGLKQRAQELEILALRLTDERDRAQIELHDSQTSSAAYIHSISELETNLSKLQQEYMEIMQKLQMQKKETDFQRQQLQEYRTKAQLALQMKDKLLEEHKANAETRNAATNVVTDNGTTEVNDVVGIAKDDGNLRLLQMELEALKQEQINWLDENRNLMQQLEDIRSDWHAYQRKQAEQADRLRTETNELRQELNQQREQTLNGEAERRMLLLQLQQLKDKEQQLRAEQTTLRKASVSISVEQQDNRIESLTNALVEKQNAVENLTAERNALRIQLEKVKDQLQQSVFSSAQLQAQRNNALLNSTDDTKAQYPLLMKENPFDNRVARRVKRAYTSLDSAGVRLGAFLRRYPLMRIFVLMYVAFLHIWVMFVLFVNMK